jgi:glycosyltransferase involved in cell wall biosynthesis
MSVIGNVEPGLVEGHAAEREPPGTGRQPNSARPDPSASRPTLSVCIPTFNRPVMVQRAIRSIVQSASGSEGEVEILVSDNSPEISEEACRQALEPWGGRSVYIGNRQNVGIPANFNECIARASGRYVVFACDDDRVLPGAVPSILESLAAGDEPVLLFQVHVVDTEGRIVLRQEFGHDESLGASGALHGLLSDNRFALFPGVVVSRDAYAAVGPFDADLGNAADIEMWVRLFARFGVRRVPTTISAYTVHSGTATQSTAFDADGVAQLMEIFQRARNTGVLSAATIHRCQARYIHSIILAKAFLNLRSGDVAAARRVMSLFDLNSVSSLGPSLRMLPARAILMMLVRCPPALVRWLMAWVDRADLVRRVRAVQIRGRAGSGP